MLTPEQRLSLLNAASVVANETETAANTANRIGTLFARIINALGDGYELNDLKDLFLSKNSTDTAAEVITFAKGLIAVMNAVFRGGIAVAGGATIAGGASIDELEVGTDLTVRGDATVAGTLRVITKIITAVIEATDITTANLTVTGVAHFFQLVIDELSSNKGAIILSQANCKADIVVNGGSYYDVYFRATDADGAAILNSWRVNDLAICMAFNGLHTGINDNVSNKYYWRRVTSVSSNVTRADGNVYHRIRLSNSGSNYTGGQVPGTETSCSILPEAGDNIVQLGYAGTDDAARRSAIILSAYITPDTGLTGPSLAFYRDIKDFNLASRRKTYLDAYGADFYGNFHVGPNEESIDGIDALVRKVYIAYCNGINGTTYTDFTTSPTEGSEYNYLGICVSTDTTQPTDPTRYTWTRIKGADGQDGEDGEDGEDGANGQEYKIEDYGSSLEVNLDYSSSMRLILGAWHFENNAGTLQTTAYLYWKLRYLTTEGKTTRYNYWSRITESFNDGTGIYTRTLTLAAITDETDGRYYTNVLGVEVELRDSTASSGYKVLARLFIPQTLQKGATFSVNQQLGQIEARVTSAETSIGEHSTSISNLDTRITQNAEAILLKASQSDLQATNAALNGVTNRVSSLEVTAEEISMKVSQQSKENENYIRNASLSSLPWIDREWTRLNTISTIRPRITSHIFRYTSATNSPKLTGDSNTAYCAILSSYISRAAGREYSQATLTQELTATSGSTYTLSVWARKQMYYGTRSLGLGEWNATVIAARAYNSSGAEDSTVTVTVNDGGHYVEFKPEDDAWHLFVVVLQMTTANIAPWFRTWGSPNEYTDWLISRPCLRLGNGITTSTYRTYTTTSTNLFANSTLTNAGVTRWPVQASITVDTTTYRYLYDGTEVTQDTLTDYIIDRLWNTETWKNSLLLAGSVDAVNYTVGSTIRSSHVRTFQQSFTASLGSALQGKTLCFSAYIKRAVKWGGLSYTAGSSTPASTLALGLEGTNISVSDKASEDTSAVATGNIESYTSSGEAWWLVRFTPNDDGWHRVWIVFILNAAAATAGFKLGFRLNITNGVADDWVITKPKLEIGSVPSVWIDYTGDEIKTVLKEAGIDIDAMAVMIHAENIKLEGLVTANEGFSIGLDGSMNANNGTFAGFVRTRVHAITPTTISDMLSDETDFVYPDRVYNTSANLQPYACEAGRWLDILKLGASVIFHKNGQDFPTTDYVLNSYPACIHLPFIASELYYGQTFKTAYHSVYTNDTDDAGYWSEVMKARSFVGCRMEIINQTSLDIMLCGIGDSDLTGSQIGNRGNAFPDEPWQYYLLPTGCMLLIECRRVTSGGGNTNFIDDVYWAVIGYVSGVNIPAASLGLDGTSG